MDEILQKLLSSELLSEDAKAEISTQWTNSVEQFKSVVREEESIKVRAEIAEQWANERDTLIENVDAFVSKRLESELSELKSDIERFRDLEAEYAEKIVEEKHKMAAELEANLDELVDRMDAFFEVRLSEEFEELKEDLEIVKQNEFGRKIFEAYASTFATSHIDENSTQSKLSDALAKLEEAQEAISKLEESKAVMVRESTLDNILKNLQGKKKEQMAFILANVETERLEEAYNHFIDRVIKEDEVKPEPAASQKLNESVVVTGDGQPAPTASTVDKHSELKKLAGIK